jgi:hypothetical protein
MHILSILDLPETQSSKVEISCKLLSNHQWNQVSLKDKLTCVTANKNLCDMAQSK